MFTFRQFTQMMTHDERRRQRSAYPWLGVSKGQQVLLLPALVLASRRGGRRGPPALGLFPPQANIALPRRRTTGQRGARAGPFPTPEASRNQDSRRPWLLTHTRMADVCIIFRFLLPPFVFPFLFPVFYLFFFFLLVPGPFSFFLSVSGFTTQRTPEKTTFERQAYRSLPRDETTARYEL